MAIEDPSSVVVDGRLRARASMPLENGRTTDGQTAIGLVLQWLNKLTDVLGNDDAQRCTKKKPGP